MIDYESTARRVSRFPDSLSHQSFNPRPRAGSDAGTLHLNQAGNFSKNPAVPYSELLGVLL